MNTGQREVESTRRELVALLQRFETLRGAEETTKDDLARAAGEIRALTQALRAMTPPPGQSAH